MEINLTPTWSKKGGRMLATAIAAVTVTLAIAPAAGAADWWPPAGATSILHPAYQPAAGHGDSIHATCAGPGHIEVAVHPYDEVARNLQVWSAAGELLVNVTSADHSELVAIADQPTTLRYSGGDPYTLDVAACATPATVPSPAPPAPTVAPPATVASAAPPPVRAAATAPGAEVATTAVATEVLASNVGPLTRLPATGVSQRLVDFGCWLLFFGLAVTVASGRRAKAGGR